MSSPFLSYHLGCRGLACSNCSPAQFHTERLTLPQGGFMVHSILNRVPVPRRFVASRFWHQSPSASFGSFDGISTPHRFQPEWQGGFVPARGKQGHGGFAVHFNPASGKQWGLFLTEEPEVRRVAGSQSGTVAPRARASSQPEMCCSPTLVSTKSCRVVPRASHLGRVLCASMPRVGAVGVLCLALLPARHHGHHYQLRQTHASTHARTHER
jgi:hypothetical protein